jgi:hypothetical protein
VQLFVENLLKVLKALKNVVKGSPAKKPESRVMLFARRTAPTA